MLNKFFEWIKSRMKNMHIIQVGLILRDGLLLGGLLPLDFFLLSRDFLNFLVLEQLFITTFNHTHPLSKY